MEGHESKPQQGIKSFSTPLAEIQRYRKRLEVGAEARRAEIR